MKTMKQLAQEALDVQDAVNLSGLVHGWSRSISDLRALLPNVGTDAINQHPVNKMWASKVHDLARMGLGDMMELSKAYDACKALAEGAPLSPADLTTSSMQDADFDPEEEERQHPIVLENLGSLITYKHDEQEIMLWHLYVHEGKVYEPNLGVVEVPLEHVAAHNAALDKALIEGLSTCRVGQGGLFYYNDQANEVRTWTGIVVSKDVFVNGKRIVFRKDGMEFVGDLRPDEEVFEFARKK